MTSAAERPSINSVSSISLVPNPANALCANSASYARGPSVKAHKAVLNSDRQFFFFFFRRRIMGRRKELITWMNCWGGFCGLCLEGFYRLWQRWNRRVRPSWRRRDRVGYRILDFIYKNKIMFISRWSRLTLLVVSATYRFYNRMVGWRRIIIWDFLYSMLSRRSARIRDECS